MGSTADPALVTNINNALKMKHRSPIDTILVQCATLPLNLNYHFRFVQSLEVVSSFVKIAFEDPTSEHFRSPTEAGVILRSYKILILEDFLAKLYILQQIDLF